MAQIFYNKGFSLGIYKLVLQFMTNYKAIMKIEDYISESFNITHRTSQRSLLSPILSALDTTNLLNTAKQWEYSDLTMYSDDGAIYATLHTMNMAAMKACDRFYDILE
jgi:hypothetical protein